MRIINNNILYPYGFIFSSHHIGVVPSNYEKKTICEKFNFYYDKSLQPVINIQKDRFIIIHGLTIHVGLKESLNNKELATYLLEQFHSNYEEFLDSLDFIGGRFAIIIGNESNISVFHDATAARSIYYSEKYQIVSSHAHLIKDNVNTDRFDYGADFRLLDFTYDHSPFSGIKGLMPNFKLNLYDGSVERYFPRAKNKYTHLSVEDRFETAEFLWKSQIQYLLKKNKKFLLSLTGGNDSRVSLAMMNDFLSNTKLFTYAASEKTDGVENIYDKTYDIDRIIVKQMLKDLNLNHKFLLYKDTKITLPPEIETALEKNATARHGRFLIGHYLKSFSEEDTLHIRANLLELGRAYLISPTTEQSKDAILASYLKYVQKKNKGKDLTKIQKHISEQNEKFYSDDFYDYHVLDISFWETRMGRWHAEILNETDIAYESFIPYNMRAIMEISLSFDYPDRKSNYFFKELINRNYPVLNFYGFNQERNLFELIQENNTDINNEYAPYKSNMFNSINVYDSGNDTFISKAENNNNIYLPFNMINKGSYAEVKIIYTNKTGVANLKLLSKYAAKGGKGHLHYEIHHNDHLLLSEDIADWNVPNLISLMNVHQDDIITIKVIADKTVNGTSWKRASIVELLSYEEVPSKVKTSKTISCTSPFSKIPE